MLPKRLIILLCISGSIGSCPISNSEATFKLLELYELPSPHDLIMSPPNKLQWKHQVKSAIHFYWTRKLKLEAKEKSSLKC
jgi:hypothetical protein